MKKSFVLMLSVLMILTGVFFCDAAQVILYDVDYDGKATAEDARFVLRCAVGLEEYTVEQIHAADTDGDGKLTASDARNVLRCAVGLSVTSEKEKYSLEALSLKIKSEYCIEDTLEISFLYSDMARDYQFLIDDSDGGVYITVYLKEPGKENLLALKEHYEGLEEVESVDFIGFAYLD